MLAFLLALACAEAPLETPPPAVSPPAPGAREVRGDDAGDAWAGSARCARCHASQAHGWAGSHHALAQRSLGAPERAALLANPRFEADASAGGVRLVGTAELDDPEVGRVHGALGVHPIWQPLIAGPGGRLQAFDQAWDVDDAGWYGVFAEARAPGEWGHWTGRGMTWNAMCASCHNTGLSRGYDPEADTYQTAAAEPGVGCEACHGPSAAHADAPEISTPQPAPGLETCAPCHSRSAPLTDGPAPGDALLDHYALLMMDDGPLYWPDGQIRDEVFEYASFLSSRMHQAGVTCQGCHDPHSGGLLREGDALCLECHAAQADFQEHSNHPPESDGARCVSCHMAETTYMQRHPRRDHGFVVPDPALGVAYGVPDACTRCHEDRDAAWAADVYAGWYGGALTPRQRRSRALAGASEPGGLPALLEICEADPHPFWRATAAGLLGAWVEDERAASALVSALGDPEPLIRAEAAGALAGRAADPTVQSALRPLLEDPVRAVRVQAARALKSTLDPDDPAAADLRAYLDRNADQPAALGERGAWRLARGQSEAALEDLERAARWDPTSAAAHQALALARSQRGDLEGARAALLAAIELEPAGARAWYMLGLLENQRGAAPAALEALARAEAADPFDPAPPFARGTILRDAGRLDEARAAAEEAARRGHPQAAALLQSL